MTALFLQVRFLDIIDILLVAWLIFFLYKLIKGTVAFNIFIGIVAFYLVWKLVGALQMEMLGEILGQFIGVGVLALIIVFQQEIRRFLLLLGTPDFLRRTPLFFLVKYLKVNDKLSLDVDTLVRSCKAMSATKTGALIVMSRQGDLDEHVATGVDLDARLTQALIETVFYKNNPLHDGAIIIRDGRVRAARCVLPITSNPNFPEDYGLRHRAAVGVTEHSDAVALIVSEQTGEIAYCKEGRLRVKLKPEQVKVLLEEDFKTSEQA